MAIKVIANSLEKGAGGKELNIHCYFNIKALTCTKTERLLS